VSRIATVDERLQFGRDIRKSVPREAHAEWSPSADRADPVTVLAAGDPDRIEDLLPIRYGRMSVSPFAYLRGSAAVMTSDLATLPSTGIQVQLCGDCHLMNFGLFATPERNLVFGLNDFDETAPGPWEYDVKRLATSFAVAARDVGLDDRSARKVAEAAVRSYRDRMWEHVEQSPLEIWYERISLDEEIERAPDAKARERRKRVRERARQRVGDSLFPKLARADGGQMSIVDQPPLLFHPHLENAEALAHDFLETYRSSLASDRRVLFDRYQLRDAAVKVVGVGSVGTRCLVALMSSLDSHPLFLQIKEAGPSVIQTFGAAPPSAHEGERVVFGQRLMQPASDIFLGWGTGAGGRHFYVRQLRDMKLSLVLERDVQSLARLAKYCGRALARGHANSGDAASIAGYLGRGDRFCDAVGSFAMRYVDQTVSDHAALTDAILDGRVSAIDESS
jgi:uncharacterized protein (DUF2252 family)